MKLLVVAAALVPAVLGLTINTPTGVVQCPPARRANHVTFGSGAAPYYVSAIPGGQVSAAALRTWDPTSASSLTWNVDIASGTSLSFIVKDSTGAQAFSDSVTVQSSSDSSCLGGSSSASTRLSIATASFVSLQVHQSHASSSSNGSRLLVGTATRAANPPTATTGMPAIQQALLRRLQVYRYRKETSIQGRFFKPRLQHSFPSKRRHAPGERRRHFLDRRRVAGRSRGFGSLKGPDIPNPSNLHFPQSIHTTTALLNVYDLLIPM
ncbi:hypothetical protein BKA70DRAFT_1524874 [Coprinopsis sp. MPI-PUGE-AT-0042]|nr:hypothetical protein BKA70DRAFT_1524874 [Coprinopsis sp. MPI-PUGE-AT-0042]